MVLTTEDRFNAGFSNFVSKLFEEKSSRIGVNEND